MEEVLEAIVAGLGEYAAAKTVVLADPRWPVELDEAQLPAVVLTMIAGTSYGSAPGHPHEIVQTDNPLYPDEEPWPYNAELVYRRDQTLTVQVDVIGNPDAEIGDALGAAEVARLAWGWFAGAGREELRTAKARVATLGGPFRSVTPGAETEGAAQERWMFDLTLVVPQAQAVTYPTVEEVKMTGQFEGAVTPERVIEVSTT